MAMQEGEAQPVAARLRLPPAYGAPRDTALMPWPSVSERLEQASHYWLCTVGPGPTPMPRPPDGVWFGNVLYFGGDPATRWRRNVSTLANASLHLEDAGSPVMLEGEVTVMGAPADSQPSSPSGLRRSTAGDRSNSTGLKCAHSSRTARWHGRGSSRTPLGSRFRMPRTRRGRVLWRPVRPSGGAVYPGRFDVPQRPDRSSACQPLSPGTRYLTNPPTPRNRLSDVRLS